LRVGGGIPGLLTNANLRAAGCRPYAKNAGFTGFRRGGNLPPAPQNPFVNSFRTPPPTHIAYISNYIAAILYTNLENHRRQRIAKNGLKPPIFRSVVNVIFRDSY